MTYQAVSGSFVYLAGLTFLFICGMIGLMVIAINAYKIVLTQLREVERDTYATDLAEGNPAVMPLRKNA